MDDFNRAVEAVCQWVESSSSWDETLLIVTADHETGYLTGKQNSYADIVNSGKGIMPKMYWHDNRFEGYVYAGMLWHTNQLVPFYAKGAGAEAVYEVADEKDPVRGHYLDHRNLPVIRSRFPPPLRTILEAKSPSGFLSISKNRNHHIILITFTRGRDIKSSCLTGPQCILPGRKGCDWPMI